MIAWPWDSRYSIFLLETNIISVINFRLLARHQLIMVQNLGMSGRCISDYNWNSSLNFLFLCANNSIDTSYPLSTQLLLTKASMDNVVRGFEIQ